MKQQGIIHSRLDVFIQRGSAANANSRNTQVRPFDSARGLLMLMIIKTSNAVCL